MESSKRTLRKEKEFINNSGRGKNTPVSPEIAERFNWGAWFFMFIWGIFNKTYLPFVIYYALVGILIVFLLMNIGKDFSYFSLAVLGIASLFSIIYPIYCGRKANTWAWQNKRWKGKDHFHSVQKKWAIAVCVCLILNFIFNCYSLLTKTVPSIKYMENMEQETADRRFSSYMQIFFSRAWGEIGENVYGNSSQGIAKYIFEGLNSEIKSRRSSDIRFQGFENPVLAGNVITTDGYILRFTGDGSCRNGGGCYLTVYNKLNKKQSPTVMNIVEIQNPSHPEYKMLDLIVNK